MRDGAERLTQLIDTLVACSESVRRALLGAEMGRLAEVVGMGADGAATTHIDQVAEEAAIGFLESASPRLNILSEEVGYIDYSADLTAIIDPIDATNNATAMPNFVEQPQADFWSVADTPFEAGHLFGYPYFAFSVGILKDGEMIAGCVRNLPTGEVYTAARGQGVKLDGIAVQGSGQQTIEGARIGLVRPETETALEAIRPLLTNMRVRLRIGGCSALDLAQISAGTLDALINPNRFSPGGHGEKIVDYAGGLALLDEMGGVLTGFDGKPISLELNLAHRTPLFAATTPELHAALAEMLYRVPWPEETG